MELSINDGNENIAKYISSVTYFLHASFAKKVVRVTEPPFRITRLSAGYFDVTMQIAFLPKFKQKEVILVHNLRLIDGGLKKNVLLEIDAYDGNASTS